VELGFHTILTSALSRGKWQTLGHGNLKPGEMAATTLGIIGRVEIRRCLGA